MSPHISRVTQNESHLHYQDWLTRGYALSEIAGGVAASGYFSHVIPVLVLGLINYGLLGQADFATPPLMLAIGYFLVQETISRTNNAALQKNTTESLLHLGTIGVLLLSLIRGSPFIWSCLSAVSWLISPNNTTITYRSSWPQFYLPTGQRAASPRLIQIVIKNVSEFVHHHALQSSAQGSGISNIIFTLILGNLDV